MNLFLFLACVSSKDADTSTDTPEDTGPPENPSPLTITVSGAYQQTLVFDEPDCSSPVGSSNMRMFWRNQNGEHVFVLVTEILGDFTGEGVYSSDDVRANIKLQEEAGGSGLYFGTNANSTSIIEYDFYDEENNFISGNATVDTLSGNDGDITISPNTSPFRPQGCIFPSTVGTDAAGTVAAAAVIATSDPTEQRRERKSIHIGLEV